MLSVEKVADLKLTQPEGATETRQIEAASGLAIIDDIVYVIADDEAYIASFRAMGRELGTTVDMVDVDIPTDPSERKKHKPDLESLTPLKPFASFAAGGIIALGSGSGPGRDMGAFAILSEDGEVTSAIQLDAGPLMAELDRRIPKLNLEGTAATEDVMRVLQRGNEPEAYNAHIDLDLVGLKRAIAGPRVVGPDLIVDIKKHDLGFLRGTKLCFSDADTLPDGRIVFSASAETSASGPDGAIAGSAVGIMHPGGEIEMLEPIELDTKVEGLAARIAGDGLEAYMVSDNDDPANPSSLMKTRLPGAV